MISDLFPSETARDVFSIDYERLYRLGYRGLLFDIDNTLVHHGDDSTPKIDALLARIKAMGFKLLMLSNNSEERIVRFLKNIDAEYIALADKPNPTSYHQACQKLGLKEKQVIVIGDQLITDIKGANLAGIASIHVHFIQLPEEKWIGWRRYIEYAILTLYRIQGNPRYKIERIEGDE